jgi:hypothetical protein
MLSSTKKEAKKKTKKTLIRVCKNDEFKKPWLHNGVLFSLFYFCDVAKLAIIHMKIWPNLAIDQIQKELFYRILL